MSKTNQSGAAKKPKTQSGQRIYVPKGKDAILVPRDSDVFVIEPGGPQPAALTAFIEKRADQLATQIVKSREQNQRSMSVEELSNHIYGLLRHIHAKDQNELLAMVLQKIHSDKADYVERLKKEFDDKQALLLAAQANLTGFVAVRNGDLDKLNFR